MAVKGGIEIIKALARKLITRDQTGIKRIPTQMEAEGEAGAIAAQIQQATGLRPGQLDKAIKSEEQVLSILNDLEYRSALSKQKESLKEFTKKEDVYEGMIDPKSDLGKKLAKLRRRGDETEPKTELIKKPPSPKKKEGIPIFADPIQQQGLNFFRSLGNKKLPVEQRVYGPFGKGTDGFRNMMLWMMQNTPEKTMEVMKQYGYKPKLVPKPKTELIKKEDVYEGMIDPKFPKSYLYTKKDGTKVKMTGDENLDYDYVETPEGYEIVPGSEGAFYRFGEKNKELIKKGSETEQQLKLRMERENKEAAERIRKKKAEEELRREFPGIDDRLIKNILVDKNPQRIAEVKQTMREALKMQEKGMSPDEIIKIFKDTTRTKQASGGIAGQLHLNEGGRVRFDKGGMSRRNFMKLIGGLAALPVVGKFFKFAKPAAKIAQLKKTTTTMPAWFPDFVDKMVTKNVGNKIDADAMLYKDKDLPGVELYKYSDGRVEVRGKNAYDSDFDINYTPPGYELIDETTGKAVKNPGDFQASDTMYTKVGPENDFSVDAEIVDDIEDILGGDSIFLEGYAKGTGKAKYTKGQRRIDEADAMNERADEIALDYDHDDFAKGGLAGVLKL